MALREVLHRVTHLVSRPARSLQPAAASFAAGPLPPHQPKAWGWTSLDSACFSGTSTSARPEGRVWEAAAAARPWLRTTGASSVKSGDTTFPLGGARWLHAGALPASPRFECPRQRRPRRAAASSDSSSDDDDDDYDESESEDDERTDQRTVRVGIVGAPNAGKSVLTNTLVGSKVGASPPLCPAGSRRGGGRPLPYPALPVGKTLSRCPS